MPRRPHLTEPEREALAAILAERPDASAGRVVLLFRARTGRTITKATVEGRRRHGPYKDRPGNGHLSGADRATLVLLVREADRRTSYREVAAQFEAAAGRPISFQHVAKFAVRELRKRPRPVGLRPGHQFRAKTEALIVALARERKDDRSDGETL